MSHRAAVANETDRPFHRPRHAVRLAVQMRQSEQGRWLRAAVALGLAAIGLVIVIQLIPPPVTYEVGADAAPPPAVEPPRQAASPATTQLIPANRDTPVFIERNVQRRSLDNRLQRTRRQMKQVASTADWLACMEALRALKHDYQALADMTGAGNGDLNHRLVEVQQCLYDCQKMMRASGR